MATTTKELTESRADLRRYRKSMRDAAERLEREAKKRVADAIAKMRGDLDWVGPSGKQLGVVVLPREMAVTLLHWCDEQWRVEHEKAKAKHDERESSDAAVADKSP